MLAWCYNTARRTANHIDALPVTGVVLVLVGIGGRVVDDIRVLDIHSEGTFAVVYSSASPGDCARKIARRGVSAGPDAEFELHRGLGEAGTALRIGVLKCANGGTVDEPGDCVGGPIYGVSVPLGLSCRYRDVDHAVVVSGVVLAEIVGLDTVVFTADEFLSCVSYCFMDRIMGANLTQSTSSRASDSMTILLTIPWPGAAFILTSK